MTRTVAFLGLSLMLAALPGHAQSRETASSALLPGAWELTAILDVPIYLETGSRGGRITTSRGFGGSVGYRPSSSRRTLVEAYGLHAPQQNGAYEQASQISAVGVRSTFLARRADRRINPYLSAGTGLWHTQAPSRPACRPTEGCLSERASSFDDGTTLSLGLGVGTYVTAHPNVALRAAATLYAPLALGGDQGNPRPVLSVGLSIRP